MVEFLWGLLGATVIWIASQAWTAARHRRDRNRVHRWLRDNTRDLPGESHESIPVIAKGVLLDEDRTRAACLTDPRIYRHQAREMPETWSVWRETPQSVYQIRSMRSLLTDR